MRVRSSGRRWNVLAPQSARGWCGTLYPSLSLLLLALYKVGHRLSCLFQSTHSSTTKPSSNLRFGHVRHCKGEHFVLFSCACVCLSPPLPPPPPPLCSRPPLSPSLSLPCDAFPPRPGKSARRAEKRVAGTHASSSTEPHPTLLPRSQAWTWQCSLPAASQMASNRMSGPCIGRSREGQDSARAAAAAAARAERQPPSLPPARAVPRAAYHAMKCETRFLAILAALAAAALVVVVRRVHPTHFSLSSHPSLPSVVAQPSISHTSSTRNSPVLSSQPHPPTTTSTQTSTTTMAATAQQPNGTTPSEYTRRNHPRLMDRPNHHHTTQGRVADHPPPRLQDCRAS